MNAMDAVTKTLKGGLINGPTLYLTQKLVSSVDAAGSNVLPAVVPQEVRTPVVGLLLASIPLFVSNGWLANKISEYTMANAVAQTLALAGNKGTGAPGVIDAAVNQVFDKVATLGATSATPTATGTQGYVRNTRGYLQPAARSTQGYLQQTAGMRTGMRGLTTEHR